MNKNVKLVITIVALAAAGGIFLATRPSTETGIEQFSGQTVLFECGKCKETKQIDKAEYLFAVREQRADYQGDRPLCGKCGTVMTEMIKCPKCGKMFKRGLKKENYDDRCPDCGFSQLEDLRNSR